MIDQNDRGHAAEDAYRGFALFSEAARRAASSAEESQRAFEELVEAAIVLDAENGLMEA